MSNIKLVLCIVLSILLGIGVIYAVNRVGELNREAAVIEACLNAPANDTRSKSCPDRPTSQAEVDSLHHTADTIGDLGWLAFFVLVFGVGGTVYEFITDLD